MDPLQNTFCFLFPAMFAFISPPPKAWILFSLGRNFSRALLSIHEEIFLKCMPWTEEFFSASQDADSKNHHQDDMGIPNLHFPRLHREGPGPHPTSQHLKEPSKKTQTRWILHNFPWKIHMVHIIITPTWKGTSSEPIFLLVFQVNVHSCVLGFNMFIFQGVFPLSQFFLSKSSTLLARFDS